MSKTKQRVIFLLFLSLCYGITMAADSPCGDWEPYKNEKCFKIIDEILRTYDDAEKACSQQENKATLVTIHSKEEQDLLSNLLFKNHKVLDNVWIGVKYNNNKFKWIDNLELSFTNWVEGSPKNETGYDCVQMIPEASSMGKWINEPCGKKNLVVCQRTQNWSISLLQKNLLDATKLLTNSLNEEKNERINSFNDVKKELDTLKQNLVPIGFIYVQLPNEKSPNEIWSSLTWKDVSSAYEGVFFRVIGGGSEGFGKVQEGNAPHVDSIHVYYGNEGTYTGDNILKANIGGHSDWSGGYMVNNFNYQLSGGEVRPRNMAIRVWKRTG